MRRQCIKPDTLLQEFKGGSVFQVRLNLVKRKILASAGNRCYSLRPHMVTVLTELSQFVQGKRRIIQNTDLFKSYDFNYKKYFFFPLTSKVVLLHNN